MAQKQFKIGLSNTDKQNMAQDVYERLLALTFPEYDTATEYEVGDFVVYNDQLYKCIGATSGAWDSTKWQLATLNDLVTDIENAVAFVNDKANVNGNYPTMTVGFADNMTPYDESAGDDQDEPFILQATGTGNGTQPDFSTGSAALMKEKQGNTVVVNNHLQNGDFSFSGRWSVGGGTLSIANNKATATANANSTMVEVYRNISVVNGHKYLVMFTMKSSVALDYVRFNGVGLTTYQKINQTAGTYLFVHEAATGNNHFDMYFYKTTFEGGETIEITNCALIDLTQWFNGDIPQDLLDHPENFFRYYQGSLAYNEGTLVNANGRYIKCIGMNQWDEEWEGDKYLDSDGTIKIHVGSIASKNYTKIIPNATYVFKCGNAGGNAGIAIGYYDRNKTYLYRDVKGADGGVAQFTTPSNAAYILFSVYNYGGSTYNHDISINLYYPDEPRCLTYEPYQVLIDNDTGTEVLRSAGNVKDTKAPDGSITRRVGYVDLGSLTWLYDTNHFYTSLNLAKASGKSVCGSPLFATTYENRSYSTNHLIWVHNTGEIFVTYQETTDAATFKSAMNGVYLYYELAEPTTEQGIPYSENLVIDDFGSMDFGSDVPQGALIFYPVDYKAFIDTLYKYTDGTPSNIALKSDVASEQSARESVDSQLLNAVGGTLRQLLATSQSVDFLNTDVVDLGTLTWNYNSSEQRFYCFSGLNMASIGASDLGKIICTKYKTDTYFQTINGNNKIGYYTDEQNRNVIAVKDTTYTDATALKAAMKGVLLAYEKASE